MAQVEQARGDHPISRLHTAPYRVESALQLAQLHRSLQGEKGTGRLFAHLGQGGLARLPFQLGQAAHHIDKRLARQLGHRRKGHRQLLTLVQHQAGATALAVAQTALGIGKGGFNQQGLGWGAHAWIHRAHLPLGQRLGAGGIEQQHPLPQPHPVGIGGGDINAGQQAVVAD